MAQQDRHLTTEELSALIDGQLTPEELTYSELHLKSCASCQQVLADLRQTVTLLRALPQPALPRSFLLTSDSLISPVAAQPLQPLPARAVYRQPRRSGYIYTTTRTLSALAAVVGLFLLLSGLMPTTTSTQNTSTASSSSGMAEKDVRIASPQIVSPHNQVPSGGKTTDSKGQDISGTPGTGMTASPPQQSLQPAGSPVETTPPLWDLSTKTGRNLLGSILLLLGLIASLVLFLGQRKQQKE